MPDPSADRYRKPKPTRRLPSGFSKEIRAYAARTGLAAWAWNTLHANLFVIFWFLVARDQPAYHATAHRIWHTIQNDSTQREMLLNVATARLAYQPAMLERVKWIANMASRMSSYRNLAAHTPAIFSHYMQRRPMADPTSTRDQTRMRFNEMRHDEFWRLLVGDLNALSAYAAGVAAEMLQPGLGGSLPRRPQLQCLAQIDRIEGQISRIAKSEERSHQQFASSLMERQAERQKQRRKRTSRDVGAQTTDK